MFFYFNLILGIFNLIPIPPLDGSKILYYLLPRSMAIQYAQLEHYGIFILLGIGVYLGKIEILGLSVFPILIMISLVEKFIAAQISKGAKTAIWLSLETLVLSVAGYYLTGWELLRSLILGYPELILLTVLINIFFGRWTGLRLSEYIRFKEVIKHVELPTKK